MRTKKEIMDDLYSHASKLDPQHYELAAVAMVETEVQIDIRDVLEIVGGIFITYLQDAQIAKDSPKEDD